MPDKNCLKVEDTVRSIVNNLAKSIVTEMTERCILKPGQEEELDALLDVLCAEAINNILRIVELLTTTKQHDPPPDNLNKSSQTEDHLGTGNKTIASKSVPYQPVAKTFFVICKNVPPSFPKALVQVKTENCESERQKNRSTVLSEKQTRRQTDQRLLCASMQPVVKLCKLDLNYSSSLTEQVEAGVEEEDDPVACSPSPPPLSQSALSLSASSSSSRPIGVLPQRLILLSANRSAPPPPPPLSQSELSLSASLAISVNRDHQYFRSASADAPYSNVTKQAAHRRMLTVAKPPTAVGTTGSVSSDDGAAAAPPAGEPPTATEPVQYPWSREVTWHVCPLCGTIFSAKRDMYHHLRTVHSAVLKPYTCDYCPKAFRYESRRDHHHAWHRGDRPFRCDICDKGYLNITQLKTHRSTHDGKSFTCDVCGNSFYHLGHLKRHKLIHAAVRPFHCDVCGRGFTQREAMVKHKVVRHGDGDANDQHLCAVCGKIYSSPFSLRSHMVAQHSGEVARDATEREKLIGCEVCGKKFLNQSGYKFHKITHQKAKPFSCHVCGKSYKWKQTLVYHLTTHSGDASPFRCRICGRIFSQRGNLQRHESMHYGETPYGCNVCHKRFRLLIFLKAHERTQGHKRRMSSSGVVVSTENANGSRSPVAAIKRGKFKQRL